MLTVRASFVCLLTSLILNSHADVGFGQEPEKKPEPAAKSKPAQPVSDETTTRISIHPKAIEAKDLENPLLPPYAEMSSGNAMLEYFRAMSYEYNGVRQWTSELIKKKNEWRTMPLHELPVEEVDAATNSSSLRILEDGARKTYADMALIDRIKRDGVHTLLGEVSALRESVRELILQARIRIAKDKFDAAMQAIRTCFAVARHLSDQIGNINFLVATALANETIASVHDWVSRPDAPNLYWPLTQLPRPLLQCDKLLESELLLNDSSVGTHSAEDLKRVMSEKDALDYFSRQNRLFIVRNISFDASNDPEAIAAIRAYVEKLYPIAAEFMKKKGVPEAELKAMPKAQLCAMFQREIAYSQIRRYARWIPFDPWVAIRQISRDREENPGFDGVELASLPKFQFKGEDFDVFASQADKYALTITFMKARLETKINVLALIEMLRDYAVDHPELPESTDALTRYPLNLTDQFTGNPIRYRRIDATTATIEAGPPEGMPGLDFLNQLRYEIRLAK